MFNYHKIDSANVNSTYIECFKIIECFFSRFSVKFGVDFF